MKNISNYTIKILFTILIVCIFSCNFSGKKYNSDSFVLNTMRDIDGNIYKTVKIGDQIWMQENLKVTHYRNGDPIPNITDSTLWLNTKKGAYCNYNNDTTYVHIYGRLYNWYAVNDSRNICPAGWHIPSDSDYAQLDYLYGGTSCSGLALKESGFTHWHKPNPDVTNLSGFTALPGGHRAEGFERIGDYAFFWNKNEDTSGDCSIKGDCAHECSLYSGYSYFNQDCGHKYRGMSVRCIKDSPEKK